MKLTEEMLREMIEGQIREERMPPDVAAIETRLERSEFFALLKRVNTRYELMALVDVFINLVDKEDLPNSEIKVVLQGMIRTLDDEQGEPESLTTEPGPDLVPDVTSTEEVPEVPAVAGI